MTKRWYVVQAQSGSEKKVVSRLQENIKLKGLQDLFEQILVPTEDVVEMKDGRKRTTERMFFPGYVLIKMEMNDDSWYLVRNTTGIHQFVGGKRDKPAPISDKEAEAILHRIQEGVEKPRPKVLFEAGEVVRITEGPFADFNGVIEEVNYEKNRLRVAVLIFGRSTPVELEFNQVQKG